MRKLTLFALCVLLVLGTVCGSASAEGNSFRTLYSGEITTLNYLVTTTTNEFSLLANMIDTLLEYDKYGQIKPSLAESWSVSDDGLVWTFKLRENATWVTYEGTYVADVTAPDFVAAAKYILDDKNASNSADILISVLAGAEEYYDSTIPPEEGEATPAPVDFATVGVKALDKYTVEYTLSAPCPYFESMVVYVPFMPVYEPFLLEKGDNFGIADSPDSILYCEIGRAHV